MARGPIRDRHNGKPGGVLALGALLVAVAVAGIGITNYLLFERFNVSIGNWTIGLLYIGSKCLFATNVRGLRRVPSPPQSITPFILFFY